jgi:hypothetical protein
VCAELGYDLAEKELLNMMAVLAPTGPHASLRPSPSVSSSSASASPAGAAAPSGPTAAAAAGVAASDERTISFESYSRALNKSFAKSFRKGERIIAQGDGIDGFYIITKGTCKVVVSPKAGPEVSRGRPGALLCGPAGRAPCCGWPAGWVAVRVRLPLGVGRRVRPALIRTRRGRARARVWMARATRA